jgi:hypothetical protein
MRLRLAGCARGRITPGAAGGAHGVQDSMACGRRAARGEGCCGSSFGGARRERKRCAHARRVPAAARWLQLQQALAARC